MVRKEEPSAVSSACNEDFDAIENCPCEDDVSSRPSFLSSMPIYNNFWEPIILYRREKKKKRLNSFRCATHTRILHHSGHPIPLHRLNVPRRYLRYLRDVSNTLVHGRWRWVTLILILCFASLWLLFAWFWMLISKAHGDLLDLESLRNVDDVTIGAVTGWRNGSCTVGVQGFAGFLLMSIETQTTIGYGSRYPTENCPEGVFLLCLQMILGIGVEGAVLGMIYVKMTRPRIRDCRSIFSKIAVICQRDGILCLMFRISDEDHLHIVGTVVKAWLTETKKLEGEEGKYIEVDQKPLKLESLGLLLWPSTVIHKIDKASPLYDFSARDILLKKFEIIINLIGTSDSTGQLTQSRTSYLNSEIHWGHRFRNCIFYDEAVHAYVVHQELFNATESIDTPLCSAQRLDEVLGELTDADLEEMDSQTSGIGSMVCSSPICGCSCSSGHSCNCSANGRSCNSPLSGHFSNSPPNGLVHYSPSNGKYNNDFQNGQFLVIAQNEHLPGNAYCKNNKNGIKTNGTHRTRQGKNSKSNSQESSPNLGVVRLEKILETHV